MPFRFLSPYFHSVAEPIEAYFFWYLDRLPKAKSGKKKLGKKSSEKKVWHFYSEFSMTALPGRHSFKRRKAPRKIWRRA